MMAKIDSSSMLGDGNNTERRPRARRPSGKCSDKVLLPLDFEPGNFDVICGRGKQFYHSVGNQRLKAIVSTYLDQYAVAEGKTERSTLVTKVVETVRSSGGNYVKYGDGRWWEVSDRDAREKTGSLFRDCLHTKYRSSSRSKVERRRMMRDRMKGGAKETLSDISESSCDGSNSSSQPDELDNLIAITAPIQDHEIFISSSPTLLEDLSEPIGADFDFDSFAFL